VWSGSRAGLARSACLPVRCVPPLIELSDNLRNLREFGRGLIQIPPKPPDRCPLVFGRLLVPVEKRVAARPRARRAGARAKAERALGHVLDHLNELIGGISLPASELDQLPHLLHDGSPLGCPGHGGPSTTSKLE